MIAKLAEKIKPWWLPLNLVLIFALGFGLGRLTKLEEARPLITIDQAQSPDLIPAVQAQAAAAALAGAAQNTNKQYVASKSGAKYHLPWCSGAQRIKEENKIWFETKQEAEQAGYGPAANCPGL